MVQCGSTVSSFPTRRAKRIVLWGENETTFASSFEEITFTGNTRLRIPLSLQTLKGASGSLTCSGGSRTDHLLAVVSQSQRRDCDDDKNKGGRYKRKNALKRSNSDESKHCMESSKEECRRSRKTWRK